MQVQPSLGCSFQSSSLWLFGWYSCLSVPAFLSDHRSVCLSIDWSACLYITPQPAKLCMPVAAGLFWLQAGQTNTVAGVNNLRGLLFFELMFMSMRAMLSALFTFPAEFKMMLKVKGSASWLCLLPLPFALPLPCSCLLLALPSTSAFRLAFAL